MTSSVRNPFMPYVGPLPQPLQHGHLIRIQGTVKPSATCFSVNLQNGADTTRRHEVALHLSPVFSPPPRLVRNSIQYQQWGPEESYGPPFPFIAGQSFEILVLVESEQFKIAVNGQHFTEYIHRLPLHTVTHIAVDGDVTIHEIRFEFGSSPSYQGSKPEIAKPIGFVTPDSTIFPSYGDNPPPYGAPPLPYPTGDISVGPPIPSGPYPPSPSSPRNPYGPSAGGSSNYTYGPPPPTNNPYGQPPGAPPYVAPPGGYGPAAYPSQGQAHVYPGSTSVYPGQESGKTGSSNLGGLAAGAAAVAGAAGAALLGKHKHGKHGHSLMSQPGAMLGGVGSLLGTGKHGHKSSSSIPIGGAVAGGAAALAGAYMLSKSPIGKVMKPKKMKKLYKHKHKLKHGFGGFGSSSSSSSEEE